MNMQAQWNERVLAAAQMWAGTPYRHMGSTKGVGCDCLGLLRGVWRDLYGKEPERLRPYAMDWPGAFGADELLEASHRHFRPASALAPGCVILFRWTHDGPARHCGIAISPDRFLHAYDRHAVMASALVPHWRRRIAGLFQFPPKPDGE